MLNPLIEPIALIDYGQYLLISLVVLPIPVVFPDQWT
jgi:hypothetical protein